MLLVEQEVHKRRGTSLCCSNVGIARTSVRGPYMQHKCILIAGWMVWWAMVAPLASAQYVLPYDSGDPASRAYIQTQWTTKHGLPQNTVLALEQTLDGYIWLGTFGGLARFDGVHFTIFDIANTPELESNRITALKVDHAGMLWIGTQEGQVIRYDGEDFRAYVLPQRQGNKAIYAFQEDAQGQFWMGGGLGLFRLMSESTFQMVSDPILQNSVVFDLEVDSLGELWVATDQGLFQWSDGRYIRRSSTYTHRIAWDQAGRLWTGERTQITRSEVIAPTFLPTTLIYPDQQEQIWLRIDNNLLRCPTSVKESDIETACLALPLRPHTLMEDRDGHVWIGSVGQGLFQLRNRWVQRYERENGLPGQDISGLASAAEGGLWVAMNCEGLARLHGEAVTRQRVSALPDRRICVRALLTDRSGALWMGVDGLLVRWHEGRREVYGNPKGPNLYFPAEAITPVLDMSTHRIAALFEDQAGTLWVAHEDGGITQFDGQTWIPHIIPGGDAFNAVYAFAEDDKGLWLGTRGGVVRWVDSTFTAYTNDDGLAPGRIRAFLPEADGTLWVGTYGGGLTRLRDGKLTRFTEQEGLYDNTISHIFADGPYLWMLGNRGFVRYRRQALSDFADGRVASFDYFFLDETEGMAEGNGGFQPAGVRDANGHFWVPTINGVAVFNPGALPDEPKPPSIIIERIERNGEVLDLKEAQTLPPGETTLFVAYNAPTFTRPEYTRFEYRLIGYQDDWQSQGTERWVTFPKLPPGPYTFEVRAVDYYGIWSQSPASYAFVVDAPFYQTRWFLSLSLVFVGFLVYGGHRLRLRTVRQQNTTLQQLVEARTGQLRESREKYRRLVENLQDEYIFYTHDKEGVFTYISPSSENVLGYTPQEALHTRYSAYLAEHPLNINAGQQFRRILAGEVLRPHDMAFLHRSGSVRILELVNMPLYNVDGEIVGIEGIAHDVTERRQAEDDVRRLNEDLERRVQDRTAALEAVNQQLRISEERYRSFVQTSYVGIWRAEYREPIAIDAPLETQYQQVLEQAYLAECNDAFAQMYGYTRGDQVIGQPLKSLFNLEVEGYVENFQSFIEAGYQVYGSEIRNIDRYGIAHDLLYSTFSTIAERRLVRSWGVQVDITESKKAEGALRESEERYRALVSNSYVGFWRIELHQSMNVKVPIDEQVEALFLHAYVAECNDAFAQMYGFASADALTGQGIDAFLDPQYPENVANMRSFIEQGYHWLNSESEEIDPLGQKRCFLISAFSNIEDDHVQWAWGVQVDITERKEAEAALKRSQRMLEKAEELASFGSFEWDISTNHVTWSDELYHIYGATPATFDQTLEAFLEYVYPDDRERVAEVVQSTLHSGTSYATEERIVRPDGEVRVLATFGEVVRNEHGQPIKVVGSCQDITERKKVEEALRESEARYRLLSEEREIRNIELQQVIATREQVEQELRASEEKFAKAFYASPDAISLTLLKEGIIAEINEGFQQMSGYTPQEVVGKHWEEIKAWIEPKVRKSVARSLLRGHAIRDIPCDYRMKSGEVRQCLLSAEKVEIGGQTYGLAVVRDITERKAAEEALRESEANYKALYEEVEAARQRLEHLSRRLVRVQEQERRRIALELHDEVGQLLTVLKLSLETVNLESPERVEQKLAEAKTLIDTLAAEVRNLSLNLRPSMLDDLGLWPTLQWYVDRFSGQTAIHVHLEQDGAKRHRFSGEVETTAFRIIQEALTNAVRYAETDEVVVGVYVEDDHLRIDVRDEGAGFDPEQVLQAHETGGLSGMRERARLVGGTVTITSQPTMGTHIRAYLPL